MALAPSRPTTAEAAPTAALPNGANTNSNVAPPSPPAKKRATKRHEPSSDSTARPAIHSTSRFISRPSSCPDVSEVVTNRQNSPRATSRLLIASSDSSNPRVARFSTHTTARTPIKTLMARPSPGAILAPNRVRGWRAVARPTPTQRGHWKPTDAGFMHSPQIGLPQRWQTIPVDRSGCR